MNERFLPIGTVCTLRGINKKIMISGFFGISYKGKLRMYDYTGVEYPEGMLLQNRTYSFNHTDIENIEFLGYAAEEHVILKNNLLNNNVSKKPVENTNITTNFKFDENGVVIFDGSVTEEVKQETKKENTINPFNQIYMKTETPKTESKGFGQFKFDANGVVIAEETQASTGFKFDANGVVVADDTVVSNSPVSEFKFDENGVVVDDGTATLNAPLSEFKFDENGVVIGDGTLVSNTPPSEFKFDENGVVVDDGTASSNVPSTGFKFDANGVVIEDINI